MFGAACNGHFKIVKWLHLNRSDSCVSDAMFGAVIHNRLEILEWSWQNTPKSYKNRIGDILNDFSERERSGYFQLVRWLHNKLNNDKINDIYMSLLK